MAELSGVHFEYGGISSRLYGLITANADTKRNTQISGEIKGVTVYNKKNQRRYLVGDDYSDFPISFEIDIVKDDERCLEYHERREIEKWLFNRHNYQKFYIDLEDDDCGETSELVDGIQKRLYLNCRFVDPKRLEYFGGIIGYTATLEADSGMWWQDTIKKTFEFENTDASSENEIIINTDTDLDDYIYPTVAVYSGANESTVTITNLSDSEDRNTSVHMYSGSTVTFDSEINYVSGGQYSAMTERNFPRLLDGENRIVVKGSVSKIVFQFQNRRAL